MNVDGQDASSSPEPVSAPTLPADVQDATHSRSTTESPRPDSRSGTEPTLASDRSDTPSQSHKPTDPDDDALVRPDTDASSRLRPSGGYDIVNSIGVDGDKLEYSVMPGRLQEDTFAPSMGYDSSNIRVCLRSFEILIPGWLCPRSVIVGLFLLTVAQDNTYVTVILPATGEQVSRYPTIRATDIRRAGGDKIRRSERVVPVWLP